MLIDPSRDSKANQAVYAAGILANLSIQFSASIGIFVGPTRAFGSFNSLKSALGPAGEGKVYHHIVEKRAANVERFGAQAIHNTRNVVVISREANQAIANFYSSIPRSGFTGGLRVREWLATQTLAEQEAFGLRILELVLGGRALP